MRAAAHRRQVVQIAIKPRGRFVRYRLLTCHFTLYLTLPMTTTKTTLPFPQPLGGPPPVERSLTHAPLERVVAQVRFPTILKIEDRVAVSNFQEKIRVAYPVLNELQNQIMRIEMGANAPITIPTVNRVWQFADAEGVWKISLAHDAMTIETSVYQSRRDLLSRWVVLLDALERTFQPTLVERIGARYVDRIVGKEFDVFPVLMSADLVSKTLTMLKNNLKFSISETLFDTEEGELMLRWGVLPPNMSPDPSAIRPLPGHSFLLDIDVWSSSRRAFGTAALSAAFRKLTERAYSVFRFAVTDEFLKAYGAES
jgi:uncharacterized protein (TIGR04255 family)